MLKKKKKKESNNPNSLPNHTTRKEETFILRKNNRAIDNRSIGRLQSKLWKSRIDGTDPFTEELQPDLESCTSGSWKVIIVSEHGEEKVSAPLYPSF